MDSNEGDCLCAILTKDPLSRPEYPTVSARKRQGPIYRRVECLMDSGAAESVADSKEFPEFRVVESPGSREGVNYYMPDGSPVPNEGQQHVRAVTEEGIGIATTFQNCRVSRLTLSVSKMSEQGNDVQFMKGGGVIRKKAAGKETRFYRKGSVYVLAL